MTFITNKQLSLALYVGVILIIVTYIYLYKRGYKGCANVDTEGELIAGL